MGRDNHNAGMHMIYWKKQYAEFEDLDFYDEYVTRKEKERKIKEAQEKAMNEKSMSDSVEIAKTINTYMNKETQKSGTEKAKKQSPVTKNSKRSAKDSYYSPENNDWNAFYKRYEYLKPLQCGTESIIPLNCFSVPNNMRANIMIIALKNKIDIVRALISCEEAMIKDKNCNPPLRSNLYCMPKLENAIVFLVLLAEKLECSIQEFFIDDPERNKRFVYRLINELRKKEDRSFWDESFDINEKYVEYTINSFDLIYGMSEHSRNSVYMDLSFEKEIFEDGSVSYSIYFGRNLFGPMTINDYMIKGAYLWEEEEGELKNFIEEVVKNHFDNTMK